jgi:hypothetical protein
MYTWLTLGSIADLDNLKSYISPEYGPESVAEKLKDGLSNAVKGVLIERNYIDKDYRSTYYSFYSKKGLRYRADCVRLHFFDSTVNFDEKSLKLRAADPRLTDHYFGFMVLRPTGVATIGRTVLSPDVRKGADRYIITAEHKVHLLGHKLMIRGFPSMDQHIDISVCAHAACWSILRHYSERYNVYREFLTYDITTMAQQFNPGGVVPSLGLELSHVERVFQEAGTFPVIVARDMQSLGDPSFYRQLLAYVDSGFPLFAAMRGEEHAIAVVGYDWQRPLTTATPGLRYSWDAVKSFAVVDDNHLPYLSIPITGGTLYSAENIDAFIVALPEKVFYPADAVDRLTSTLFNIGAPLTLPARDETIIRYFITTGSALRHFVRDHESEFDPKLVKAIMMLPFAQFVWIVEFSTEGQWGTERVSARAVIDATASLVEFNPLWLIHSESAALIFNRERVSLDLTSGIRALRMSTMGHLGFSRMAQNLRPTQTK